MTENFFLDNLDIQFRLSNIDLEEILDIKENGYKYSEEYPVAPRSYVDALNNYRIMLEILGDISANVIVTVEKIKIADI